MLRLESIKNYRALRQVRNRTAHLRQRRISFSPLVLSLLIVLSAMAFALTNGNSGLAATGAYEISGTVTDQNGLGVSGVSVTATDPGGSTVLYGPSTTTIGGGYSLLVDAGTYDIHFDPASGSGLTPVVQGNVSVAASQTINIQFFGSSPTVYHTFSGTLTNLAGEPLVSDPSGSGFDPSYYLSWASADSTTNSQGQFSFGQKVASVYSSILSIRRSDDSEFPRLDTYRIDPYAVDLTNSDVTQTIAVPEPDTTVTVVVKDSSGNPVEGAGVSLLNADAPALKGKIDGVDRDFVVSTRVTGRVTDQTGSVDIELFKGMTIPTSRLSATVDGLTARTTQDVTVDGDLTITLQLPPPTVYHTFSGTLTNLAGEPLVSDPSGSGFDPSYYLSWASADSTTNSQGQFSFGQKVASVYSSILSIRRSDDSEFPRLDTYRIDPYAVDLTNSDVTQTIAVPEPDTTVTVVVKDSSGNPVEGAGVSLLNADAPALKGKIDGVDRDFVVSTRVTGRVTDQTGSVDIELFKGMTIPTSRLSATVDGLTARTTQDVTVDGKLTIIFQQGGIVIVSPGVPQNLAITSPTAHPNLSWDAAPNAVTYNIYRDGTKIGSSTTTEFTDNSVTDGNYGYSVTAVNAAGESDQSSNINVQVDQTAPNISYDLSPVPDGDWNKSDVTVMFTCADNDGGSGIANCPAPVMVSAEGANQTVTGTATDNAGNTATVTAIINLDKTGPTIDYAVEPAANDDGWNNTDVTVTFSCSDALSGVASCPNPLTISSEGSNQQLAVTGSDNAGNATDKAITINVDKTAPIVGAPAWTANPVTLGNDTSFVVTANDNLSGVEAGEYFIGTDPGVGSATVLSWDGTYLSSGQFGANLQPGVYNVGIRAQDAAGNWSSTTTVYLVVFNPSGPGYIVGQQNMTPTSSDTLPWISSSTKDFATFGFNVKFNPNGTVDPTSSFSFNYDEKGNCGTANTPACHTFDLEATSFDWLGIGGTSDSQGTFQGTATLTINGSPQTVLFRVEAVDGNQLTPTESDSFALKIYTQGSDPQTATPLYQVSADFTPHTGNANGGVQVKG